jgi:AcrR family transcriptional regulator
MTAKSSRTRERILDATARVLSKQGYAGTRLVDVADEAGLQAPAIYYYFPSRELLIEEVMWVGIAHMREHLETTLAGLPADSTPLDRILAGVEAHLRFELLMSDYTTAAIRNSGQVPEGVRTRQAAEEAEYGRLWRRLFQDARAAGLIRADLDLHAARMLVMGALNWTAEWWNPATGSLDELVTTAKSIVLAGLHANAER